MLYRGLSSFIGSPIAGKYVMLFSIGACHPLSDHRSRVSMLCYALSGPVILYRVTNRGLVCYAVLCHGLSSFIGSPIAGKYVMLCSIGACHPLSGHQSRVSMLCCALSGPVILYQITDRRLVCLCCAVSGHVIYYLFIDRG